MKTMTAYKLFRIKEGRLYPLYVNADKVVPVGKWLEAEPGELLEDGKVKSKLGHLAYRPGWHCSTVPVATHIGKKARKTDKKPSFRPANQVWAEVEIRAEKNWQLVADEQGKTARDKQLKVVPVNGYYRYKTNPNMYGDWLISGEIKVLRILEDSEVREINRRTGSGVHDLPRKSA